VRGFDKSGEFASGNKGDVPRASTANYDCFLIVDNLV
jgi:hypothetical protein